MAKDPAFLFYPGDWQGGTSTFSRHIKGCYMDILIAQFNAGPLSIEEIKTVLGTDFAAWGTLTKKFKKTDDGLFFNERLETEKLKRKEYTQSRRDSRLKSDEDNVRIYLIKDLETGYIKIGSSVNPQRRLSEMINQKNPAITVGHTRNYQLLWHSEPCLRKIESEIHNYFLSNRIKGEWFSLSDDELDTLLRTFFRTSLRTENENRNKDLNKKEKESELENFLKYEMLEILDYPLNQRNISKATGIEIPLLIGLLEDFKNKREAECSVNDGFTEYKSQKELIKHAISAINLEKNKQKNASSKQQSNNYNERKTGIDELDKLTDRFLQQYQPD